MACQICGNPTAETRMGACWECVEAETIIEEGLDMYDKGIDGLVNNPAKSSMDKLKFLISKGWTNKSISI